MEQNITLLYYDLKEKQKESSELKSILTYLKTGEARSQIKIIDLKRDFKLDLKEKDHVDYIIPLVEKKIEDLDDEIYQIVNSIAKFESEGANGK